VLERLLRVRPFCAGGRNERAPPALEERRELLEGIVRRLHAFLPVKGAESRRSYNVRNGAPGTLPGMTSKKLLSIDDDNFDREVTASELPVMLEFTAAWCGPCKALLPILERIAEENADRVRVGAVDVDDSPGLARRFGVRGAPTVVVLRGGLEVARQLGVTSRGRLLGMLEGAEEGRPGVAAS
jgi:thioredoxin 1